MALHRPSSPREVRDVVPTIESKSSLASIGPVPAGANGEVCDA